MACIDPRIDPIVAGLSRFHQEVAEQLARMAQSDPAALAQIREVCTLDLEPGQREILSHAVALLGDEDTVIAGLNLIRDDAAQTAPYHLVQAIEGVVLDREAYAGMPGAYSLVPHGGSAVRSRLFAMVTEDPTRRRAAFSLLGQIEEWRLEHGRPLDEPRHPDIDSDLPWPPLELIDSREDR